MNQLVFIFYVLLSFSFTHSSSSLEIPIPVQGNWLARNYTFEFGGVLNVNLHYRTFGTPTKDPNTGLHNNVVLLLHGTGGSGAQFLAPQFSSELFNPGQLLDIQKYYIIMPDHIGHGNSSKPSNTGLRMNFPKYFYNDMVILQYLLVTQGLGINHLRLLLGTSQGCMNAYMWGERYATFMDALMPLACLTVEIGGRNRVWRNALAQSIMRDPAWMRGNYQTQPIIGLSSAAGFLLIAGSAPILWQNQFPDGESADLYYDRYISQQVSQLDANDYLYQVNGSYFYNPHPTLESIEAHLMHVNTGYDFINPVELSVLIGEQEIKRVKYGTFVLIPASNSTHGHGSHTWAVLWKNYLQILLEQSKIL